MIEEVDALNQPLADPAFPHITHRRGASRQPVAVLRGTGIRVQAIVVAARQPKRGGSPLHKSLQSMI
jgi:hypothetical protein